MKNLEGQKFGKLTVIKFEYKKNYIDYYKCKCECGKEKIIRGYDLKSGKTKSCGCVAKGNHTIHKKSKTKLYWVWQSMKARCNNENNKRYKHYGGRGIKVCEEWSNDYSNFHNWAVQNGYKEGLTIDRIDVNKNYEPNNCRWVTKEVQANNMTTNKVIKYKGLEMNIAQWEKFLRLPKNVLRQRIEKLGWSIEKAIETKSKSGR